MIKEILAIGAGVLLLSSYILYLYQMWWGPTRPSRSSWWIITAVWLVLFLSSFSGIPEGGFMAATSIWIAIASLVGTFAVAVSSIWRGSNVEEKWGPFDYACAIFAAIALGFYFIFHNPEVSFIFAILADLSGLFPTIKNAKHHPEQEDLTAWVLTVASCVLGVIAVSDWGLSFRSASNWALPVYLVIVDSIVVFFIARRFFRKKS